MDVAWAGSLGAFHANSLPKPLRKLKRKQKGWELSSPCPNRTLPSLTPASFFRARGARACVLAAPPPRARLGRSILKIVAARVNRDQHPLTSRLPSTNGKTCLHPSKQQDTQVSSSMSEQEKNVLRWFRRHNFGRLWEIDCDFKLRHKVGLVCVVPANTPRLGAKR